MLAILSMAKIEPPHFWLASVPLIIQVSFTDKDDSIGRPCCATSRDLTTKKKPEMIKLQCCETSKRKKHKSDPCDIHWTRKGLRDNKKIKIPSEHWFNKGNESTNNLPVLTPTDMETDDGIESFEEKSDNHPPKAWRLLGL